ncbi:hypothetical protein [Bacillus sp. FJAT-29937]|uniref:hypothetical protein n=1 Tax=Bacillus sp. FJAT-29937 TaxID=1720553 RepID=UPI000836F3F8|nr:hypothetical protein [Bacillus sp. FJAT-29937]
MIRMNNLPEHIKNSLKPFYKQNETPDVFPSMFKIDDEIFYYFTFAPIAEQLIMKEDGTVPSFHQVQKEALIFNSYNVSIETVANIGKKWAESGKKEKYQKLIEVLNEIKEKLGPFSPELENAFQAYYMTAKEIIEFQTIINESVKRATAIWDRTNLDELATHQDQIDMRNCIVDMTRAAYRQNEIQLKTEYEREQIWGFVSSKRWAKGITGMGLYLKLKPYQKDMMKNTSENVNQANELGKMVLNDDLPLEQHENAKGVLTSLRNPKTI